MLMQVPFASHLAAPVGEAKCITLHLNCILQVMASASPEPDRHSGTMRAVKRERQRAIRELVARFPIASQQEFAEVLAERGFDVTQATVSRDIAELGLVKVVRADRHVYASPEDLAPVPVQSDETLRRLLTDLPVSVRRSGLILLLISTPGSANAIAQAIDESNLNEQEGTVAGDNTVLVLFSDQERLARWQQKLERLRGVPVSLAAAGRATE
jgi:transcriptional regulator of arginine metabolism